MVAAAANVVPVMLELGGKSPQLVFADCDLDAALGPIVEGITAERRAELLGRLAPAGAPSLHAPAWSTRW